MKSNEKRKRMDTTVDPMTDAWFRHKSKSTGLPVGRLLDSLVLSELMKERNKAFKED